MKHRYLLLFFISIFYSSYLNAQKPSIVWSKCLGGSQSENLSSISYQPDGGVVVGGETESNDFDISGNHGMSDFFIAKLNSSGNILWKKTLGGSSTEDLHCIMNTSDGNIVVMGNSTSNDGDVGLPPYSSNIWLIKLNQNGEIIWTKNYPIFVVTLLPNDQGGFYIFGNINLTFSCGIINSAGELTSVIPLSLTNLNATIYSIKRSLDGGFLLCGTTCDICYGIAANKDYIVIKYDANFNKLWEKVYGGSKHDFGSSLVQMSNGDILVSGITNSEDGNVTNHKGSSDCWVIRLNSSGNIVWEKTFGGSLNELMYEIEEINQNKYILFGSTASIDGDVSNNIGSLDFWVVIFDPNGNIITEKNFGGYTYDADFMSINSNKIELISENEFYIGGATASNNVDVQGNHGSWDYWVARLKICKDDLQITENLQLGEKFEANSMIESNSKILPVGNIIFDAGKKIILNPGFEAQTGGIFQAYIDGCGKN